MEQLNISKIWLLSCLIFFTDRQDLRAGVHFKVRRRCSSRSMSDTDRLGLQAAVL